MIRLWGDRLTQVRQRLPIRIMLDLKWSGLKRERHRG
jgi:hypothetical protein